MDKVNALISGGYCIMDYDGLAIDPYFTFITGINPCQYLHEGRFSRAVFPHKRMDFSRFDVKMDILQNRDAGKFLCDVRHL